MDLFCYLVTGMTLKGLVHGMLQLCSMYLGMGEWVFLCDIAVYNLGQNICRLFLLFLAQFLFTISETEPDYYHQKASERVASRDTERLKTLDLRKLGNFQKIPEMLGFDSKYPAGHPKTKF